jgi:hypothetical protein
VKRVWHAHPVGFLDGNPIVGYTKLKDGVRLLFVKRKGRLVRLINGEE